MVVSNDCWNNNAKAESISVATVFSKRGNISSGPLFFWGDSNFVVVWLHLAHQYSDEGWNYMVINLSIINSFVCVLRVETLLKCEFKLKALLYSDQYYTLCWFLHVLGFAFYIRPKRLGILSETFTDDVVDIIVMRVKDQFCDIISIRIVCFPIS